jgi:hypothetical protein
MSSYSFLKGSFHIFFLAPPKWPVLGFTNYSFVCISHHHSSLGSRSSANETLTSEECCEVMPVIYHSCKVRDKAARDVVKISKPLSLCIKLETTTLAKA